MPKDVFVRKPKLEWKRHCEIGVLKCKECAKAYQRAYYNSPEGNANRKTYQKAWRKANIERLKIKEKMHYQSHKEEIIKKQELYYQSHKEEIRAYHKMHYKANKERINIKTRAYVQSHKAERWLTKNKNVDSVTGYPKASSKEELTRQLKDMIDAKSPQTPIL